VSAANARRRKRLIQCPILAEEAMKKALMSGVIGRLYGVSVYKHLTKMQWHMKGFMEAKK